jgi:hypothetical protein
VEIVILLAFIGLLLVGGALALFTRSVRDRDWQHVDRLALFPIHDDTTSVPRDGAATTEGT